MIPRKKGSLPGTNKAYTSACSKSAIKTEHIQCSALSPTRDAGVESPANE